MWDFGKFASKCKGAMCLPQALCSILKPALLKGDHVSIHGTPVSPGDKLLLCMWSHRVYTEYPVLPTPGSPPFSSAAPPLGHTPSFLPWTRAGGWGYLLTDLLLPPQSCTLLPHSSWSNLVKSEIRSMPSAYWYPPMVPIALTIKVSLLTWTSKPCDVWAQPPLESWPCSFTLAFFSALIIVGPFSPSDLYTGCCSDILPISAQKSPPLSLLLTVHSKRLEDRCEHSRDSKMHINLNMLLKVPWILGIWTFPLNLQ